MKGKETNSNLLSVDYLNLQILYKHYSTNFISLCSVISEKNKKNMESINLFNETLISKTPFKVNYSKFTT